jgi:hypothetical protein
MKMAPFEALYGRQCRTLLNWIELGEKAIFGPDIVVEVEATVRVLAIKFYKIKWSSHMIEEATWESENFLRSRHPDFELL